MIEVIRNEKGNALIFVIIIMVVMVALAPALVLATNVEIKQATSYENRTQAYYYARSGVENALEWLVDGYQLNENYDGEDYIAGNMSALAYSDVNPGTASDITVAITTIDNSGIQIAATGTYNGVTENLTVVVRTTIIDANAYVISDFDKAIFIIDSSMLGENLSIQKQDSLEGDIGIMLDEAYELLGVFDFSYDDKKNGGWNDDNTIYLYLPLGEEHTESNLLNVISDSYPNVQSFVDHGVVEIVENTEIVYPSPVFPTLPPNTSTEDASDETIDFRADPSDRFYNSLNGHLTVYLNKPDEDRIYDNRIYVNNFNISSITINNTYDWENAVEGESPYRLNVYVYDSFDINGNEKINDGGNVGDFMLYHAGTSDWKFNGNNEIYGSVFFEEADGMKLNGNSGFMGHIIIGSGNVELLGNSDILSRVLYAPDTSIYMGGNTTFMGSIVSYDVTCKGSGSVIYDDSIDLMTFPWEIFDDPNGGGGGNESAYKRVLGYYYQ